MNSLNTLLTNSFPEQGSTLFDLPDILKTMREGILVVGENMCIAAANDAAIEVFARRKETFLNKRLSEVIRNFSVHDSFLRALEKNKSSQVKIEILNPENRSFDASISPLCLGESKYAIGVFYDITQVEHLENVRQEFLSNISHELRTPLTSILAFVETLENGGIDDNLNNRRFLSTIRKNAKRMQHLIDDISELSSIEAGKINLDLKAVNLSQLVKEVFASLSAKAENRNISLKNDVQPDVEVFADEIRLEQMLVNLVENAIKFNRKEGLVTVRFSRQDMHDLIEVSDTGEGILKEHMPRIFERLYRADRARSREIGGTGLGLSIVKHLARLHGGEIKAISSLGKGSVFSIQLPVHKKN